MDLQSRAYEILKRITAQYKYSDLRRYGNSHDGGYVVPAIKPGSHVLLSFGVGNDISFEKDLESIVTTTHLYDHTIDSLPNPLKNGIFFKEMIHPIDGIRFEESLRRFGINEKIILKSDIEGHEWETLAFASVESLLKIEFAVIEFHDLRDILIDDKFNLYISVLDKLLNIYTIVNLHPNNFDDVTLFGNLLIPNVVEITFVRTDLLDLSSPNETSGVDNFSVNLNSRNNPYGEEIWLQSINFYHPVVYTEFSSERISNRYLSYKLLDSLYEELNSLKAEYFELKSSTIWQVTAPYRFLINLIKRLST